MAAPTAAATACWARSRNATAGIVRLLSPRASQKATRLRWSTSVRVKIV